MLPRHKIEKHAPVCIFGKKGWFCEPFNPLFNTKTHNLNMDTSLSNYILQLKKRYIF